MSAQPTQAMTQVSNMRSSPCNPDIFRMGLSVPCSFPWRTVRPWPDWRGACSRRFSGSRRTVGTGRGRLGRRLSAGASVVDFVYSGMDGDGRPSHTSCIPWRQSWGTRFGWSSEAKTSPRDGNAGQSRARHRCSPWSWGELRFSRLISTACASTSRMEHSRPLVVDNGTGVSHRFRSDQQLHQEVRSERSDS